MISNVVVRVHRRRAAGGVGSRRPRRRDGRALRHRRHGRGADGPRPRRDRRRSSSTTRVDAYAEREKEIEGLNEGLMRDLERFIVLQIVDVRWREHLENMDYMREGIHLRGMAQKDPLVEYRNEGHIMFQELNRSIREEVVTLLFHAVEVVPADEERPRCRSPAERRRAEREPHLRARVARRRRRDRGRRRGRRRRRRGAGGEGGGAPVAADRRSSPSTRTSAATTRAGAARARSSSAATARDRARARSSARSICLDPITPDDAGDLDWLARDDDVRRFTRVPSEPRPELRRRVGRRATCRGWQDGSRAGFVDPHASTAQFLGFAAFVAARPRRPARARSATPSPPAARGRGVASRGGRRCSRAGASTSSGSSGSSC